MIHVKQPENSSTCGQHCVAMVTGRSVQDVIDAIGKKGATSSLDLIKGLNHFGLQTSSLMKYKARAYMTKVCIMLVNWKRAGAHWVVYNDGLLYDPGYDGVVEFNSKIYMKNGTITSHINIWE